MKTLTESEKRRESEKIGVELRRALLFTLKNHDYTEGEIENILGKK